MEPDARYTFVGAAVLALTLALVVALVWLQGGNSGGYRRYTIYYERLPLDGLAVGSDVQMRGLKVGSVEDYSIQPANINRVRVLIRVDRRTPVSVNTVAGIDRNYVTRVARVDLQTPGEPGPLRSDVPANEPYPVIPEGRSDLAEITGTLKGLGERASDLISAANELVNPENRAAVTTLLASATALVGGLNDRLGTFDRTLAQVARAANDVGAAGRRIDVTVTRFGEETTPAMAELRGTVSEARIAIQALTGAATTLEREATALAGRTGNAAEEASEQLIVTSNALRHSLATIARVVEALEHPRAALVGPSDEQLGPGESRR